MDRHQANKLTELLKDFVESNDDLRALGGCGSWARGNPRPDSDLDLIIIARDQNRWQMHRQWVHDLPFDRFGFTCAGHSTAAYGAVWSIHIELEPDAKLELSFAPAIWASTDPVDSETRRIVADAFEIIVDRDRLLARLIDVCNRSPLDE